MIVERLKKLSQYNIWAWDHVIDSMRKISDEEFRKERPFFWESLHGLLAHSLAAEIIWIERLNHNNPTTLLNEDNFQTLDEIVKEWQVVRNRWNDYLDQLNDETVLTSLSFADTQGFERSVVIADIITHVFNHATDHRSQMTPFLHQLGFATPSLDYVYFCEGREL